MIFSNAPAPHLPNYPRLRLGINVVRTSENSILFMADPTPLSVNGPDVLQVILPLIEIMDGRSSFSELVTRLPNLSAAEIDAALTKLCRIGVLADGPVPINGPQLDTQVFMERFIRITNHRASESLACIDFHKATFQIECSAYWAQPLCENLQLLGTNASIKFGGFDRQETAFFASVFVKQISTSINLCVSSVHKNLIFVTAEITPSSSEIVDLNLSPYLPEHVIPSIISHWVYASCLGMPVASEISRFNTAPSTNTLATSSQAIGPDEHEFAADTPLDVTAKCKIISTLAVGWLVINGTPKHIAPTAGGMASVHAIWIVPTKDSDAVAYYFDAWNSKLVQCASVRLQTGYLEYNRPVSDAFLLLFSSPSILRGKYGKAALRLACYDTGFAFDHATRARAFGTGLTKVENWLVADSIKKLLPNMEDWKSPCATLALARNDFSKKNVTSLFDRKQELRLMLKRQSVRIFSSTIPPIELVVRLEQLLMRRLMNDSLYQQVVPNMTVVRLWALNEDFIGVCCFKLDGEKLPIKNLKLPRNQMTWIIKQSDLANAPLVYLLISNPAKIDFSSSDREREWGMQGAICNSIWTSAISVGLVGAPFGSADASFFSLTGSPSEGLALCLGFEEYEAGVNRRIRG